MSSRARDFQRLVLYFQVMKNHENLFFVICVLHIQYYCRRKISFLENIVKKTQGKVGRTRNWLLFSIWVTNCESTKTRMKNSTRLRAANTRVLVFVFGSKALYLLVTTRLTGCQVVMLATELNFFNLKWCAGKQDVMYLHRISLCVLDSSLKDFVKSSEL